MGTQQPKQEAIKQLPVYLSFAQNVSINLYEILSIESLRNYSTIELTTGKSIVICKCLAVVESLRFDGLIRVNKHIILAKHTIKKIAYTDTNHILLTTTRFRTIEVARRRIIPFLKEMNLSKEDLRASKHRSIYLR